MTKLTQARAKDAIAAIEECLAARADLFKVQEATNVRLIYSTTGGWRDAFIDAPCASPTSGGYDFKQLMIGKAKSRLAAAVRRLNALDVEIPE